MNDRTSELKNETEKGIVIYRLEFELKKLSEKVDMTMKENMEKIKDNEKEKKENYVLNAVTRHYSNNIQEYVAL